jgi:hypothetical protein
MIILPICFDTMCTHCGARGRVVVEALSYKPEGRGFETQSYKLIFFKFT